MARILFTSWPFPRHVYPHVAIAQALRSRGHEIAFYTGRHAARVVEDEGFKHFPFRRLDEDRLYETLFSPGRGSMLQFGGVRRFASMLHEWLLGTIPAQIEDLEPVLRE